MNNPLVSILIPVYNRENIVEKTIQSALNQTYKNIEIIIVDNKSTDGTWQILENYPKKDKRVKIYQNEANLGPVRNWKKCMFYANGEFAKILFSDDFISENFVEESLKCMNDDVAFVISKVIIFDSDTNKIVEESHLLKKTVLRDNYIEDILLVNKNSYPVSPGAAFFRTEDLKESYKENFSDIWGLDFKKFGAGNDLWFFLKTAFKYEKIIIQPKAISYFRSHQGSFSISNNLALYYEIAKFEFQKAHTNKYLSKFKTILLVKLIKANKFKALYSQIQSKIDVVYLIRVIIHKITLKIRA